MIKQIKCVDRVAAQWASREADLKAMLRPTGIGHKALLKFLYDQGVDTEADEPYRDLTEKAYEQFSNYALSFDYVAPHTFTDQAEGYFRYQMSWGGPSDEIRFYSYDAGRSCYRAEYWFMDWFDGAKVDVTGTVADDVFAWFQEVGATESEYEKAMADYEPPVSEDEYPDDDPEEESEDD